MPYKMSIKAPASPTQNGFPSHNDSQIKKPPPISQNPAIRKMITVFNGILLLWI